MTYVTAYVIDSTIIYCNPFRHIYMVGCVQFQFICVYLKKI